MTDAELSGLRAGDVISSVINGRSRVCELVWVGRLIECINPRSGAYGHYARRVRWESGSGNGWIETSLESDEYLAGLRYPPFENGARVRGEEIVSRADDAACAAALARSGRCD